MIRVADGGRAGDGSSRAGTAGRPEHSEDRARPARRGAFYWRVYADATCAGLTPLIPVPFVDLVLERYFRRRMPAVIARVRGRRLSRLVELRLGRREATSSLAKGCLGLPFAAGRYVVMKLWRKVVYVFAIADASEQLSAYWHRAYLIDHVIRAGHLDPGTDTERSLQVVARVLGDTDTSPLRGLARQVVASTGGVLRLLLRARRRDSAVETSSLGETLRSHWGVAERSLTGLAVRYNRLYSTWQESGGAG